MLVQELYNKLALITGFPSYTNDTDAPEINRFLLEMLSEGLQSTIDNLYISNNILQRDDTIVTQAGVSEYGINGIIKNLQVIRGDSHRRNYRIPYNDLANPNRDTSDDKAGSPDSYVIRKGYLKLLPTPDKEYVLKVTVSTVDLVLADNDVSKSAITHINDAILADARFCDLVVLKAATFVFLRCQNQNAQLYAQLYEDRLKTYLEHDNKSLEAQRLHIHRAGNYNPSRGLLDDDYFGGF
jgi:hypothetical protein